MDEGALELHGGVGAEAEGGGHGDHEAFAANRGRWRDRRLRGDDDGGGAAAFGQAAGDREKDAVAKGDDGLLHGSLRLVVA